MKKKNKRSAVRTVLTLCLAVLLALSAFAVIVNKMQGKTVFAFGYTCLWVQTGSMEPTIPTKSYILVKKTDAADCTVGDVIVFVCRDADSPVYGSLVTHRIDEVTPEGFRLGNGGGFFDRYMAKMAAENRRPMTVAVAYDALVTNDFCPQAHDVAFDWIATESGVRRSASL